VTGIWGIGFKRRPDGTFATAGQWDLVRLKIDKARDLEHRLDTEPGSRFCPEARQ